MDDLIERLEAAEFGGFGFDSEIFIALNLTQPRLDGLASTTHPPITTSLDAALALAERVCPDHHSSVGNLPVSDDADYEEHHHFGALLYSRYTKPCDALGHGATRALALCIAILRAKMETEK